MPLESSLMITERTPAFNRAVSPLEYGPQTRLLAWSFGQG